MLFSKARHNPQMALLPSFTVTQTVWPSSLNSACVGKVLLNSPLGPLTITLAPSIFNSTPAGRLIDFFPILDMFRFRLNDYYQISNKTSPPTLARRAAWPVKIPRGVDSTAIPKPFFTG